MFVIPSQNVYFEWLPLLTAQLVLLVLLYFTVCSRKTLLAFPYHAVCLFCFFLYFGAKPFQLYTAHETGIYLLFIRTFLYTGVAVPALVAALFEQCLRPLSKPQLMALFLCSVVSCLLVIFIQDIVNYNYLLPLALKQSLPFDVTNSVALIMVTFQIVALFMLPVVYLLWMEITLSKDLVNLAFLSGAAILSAFQLVGSHIYQAYWLLYFGAIIAVLCWVGAVYFDLLRIRGRAQVIKDELGTLLRSGKLHNLVDIEQLWRRLEDTAEGDLSRYKLQVREVLTRLADIGIHAGVNSQQVVARAAATGAAIDKSFDAKEVRSIATQEILQLGILVDHSRQTHHKALSDKAKDFIQSNFASIKDVNQVAKHCAVSRSSLMTHFKRATGQTLNAYLTDTRIAAAKELLADLSVTDTAFAVGFNDANYFSTVFKKLTSQTPLQYKVEINT